MKVLVIGQGGREHALTWKVAQSPLVQHIYVAPGNPGTALEAKTRNVPIEATDIVGLRSFAQQQGIDLTLVGPEAPLAAGIVDQFRDLGLNIIGPTQQAAKLESSKAFCKQFMESHGIPTAHYATFDDPQEAKSYLQQQRFPIVLKADGLAAGKGVIIAHDHAAAEEAIDSLMQQQCFGTAGSQIVIEEFLQGEEASYMVLVDGHHILPLASSQDHKARDNHDRGPNTGGMGAYSPAPIITPTLEQRILEQIITPVVAAMAQAGHAYTGFLYAGLMIDAQGEPKVLEFNCRLGDPETQPLMMRLRSDLITLCQACVDGNLHEVEAQWDPQVALSVVACAAGYPEAYQKGDPIEGLLPPPQEGKLFFAGISQEDQQFKTQGGRVLSATALAHNVTTAQQKAYQLLDKVHFKGMYYRTDIGYRAIAREDS